MCDQQQYMAVLEAAMFSTPEGCTDNSHITPNQYQSTKNLSVIKLLRQFPETLDVKQKTAACRLGTDKSNPEAEKTGNALCSNISNHHVHTKINQKFR